MPITLSSDVSSPGSADDACGRSSASVQWRQLRAWYIARREYQRIKRHGTRLEILRVLSGAPIQKVVTKRRD